MVGLTITLPLTLTLTPTSTPNLTPTLTLGLSLSPSLSLTLALTRGSMLAADLVMAGSLRKEAAATLVEDVRSQLRPVLQVQSPREAQARHEIAPRVDIAPPLQALGEDVAAGLDAFQALLYRPAYEPRPLAQNLCLEPAIAATLDQCGSL